MKRLPPARAAVRLDCAYASYGGVFVVLSLLWGWHIDGVRPDRFDLFGAAIVLAGVAAIVFRPRP